MKGTKNSKLAIIFVLIAGLFPIGSNAAKDLDVAALIKERSAALVTVKYVLNVNMGNARGNQENETANELTCTMISADGLIVCSNNKLGGFFSLMKNLSPQLGKTMSATPKNFEVLVDTLEKSFDAEILAVDTERDLVWIRITEADENSFSFIDLTSSTPANIGDTVISLRRTGEHFGRTPVVSRNHIGGISEKPRKLYILEAPTGQGAGLPTFSANGKLIGLMVIQLPETSNNMGALSGFMGGNMADLQEGMSGLILPAEDIAKATQRAMEVESY
jgi:S1-C subfamily serine protease